MQRSKRKKTNYNGFGGDLLKRSAKAVLLHFLSRCHALPEDLGYKKEL